MAATTLVVVVVWGIDVGGVPLTTTGVATVEKAWAGAEPPTAPAPVPLRGPVRGITRR